MIKLNKEDGIYYALIIIFLGATLYLLAPALFKQGSTPSNPVIVNGLNSTPVNLTILSSSSCKILCQTIEIEASLKSIFGQVNVRRLDVNSTEGRAIADQHNLTIVPAYLLDSSVQRSPAFSRFSNFLWRSGDSFILASLDTQSGFLFRNEPSATPSLVLFGTSFDINSINTQNKTFSVLSRFNNSVNFSMHYAVHSNGTYLTSPNGHVELIEDALQLCAMRQNSPNIWNAISCRSSEIARCTTNSSDAAFCAQFWKTCIGGWGLNTDDVEACVRTENLTIQIEEAKITQDNEINSVPTTIVGNQYRFVGQKTELGLFGLICGVYPDLPACTITVRNG